MGKFVKFYSANMSLETNLPNFPAAKVSLHAVLNFLINIFKYVRNFCWLQEFQHWRMNSLNS